MNAEFFRAGVRRGAEPQAAAVDLLLIENRRPRAMFCLCCSAV